MQRGLGGRSGKEVSGKSAEIRRGELHIVRNGKQARRRVYGMTGKPTLTMAGRDSNMVD